MQAGFFLNIASEINLPCLTFKNQLIQESGKGLVSKSGKGIDQRLEHQKPIKTINAQENLHLKWKGN